MVPGGYDREAAVAYAHQWALGRNPAYYNFTGIGGDCTNFVSQCIHAGGAPMNFTRDLGWYYRSPADRAAAWSGVEYLYAFLMGDWRVGPFARHIAADALIPGDVVMLSFVPGLFSHSLFVVQSSGSRDHSTILIAAHSDDSDYRPLSTYWAIGWRYLRIGVRA